MTLIRNTLRVVAFSAMAMAMASTATAAPAAAITVEASVDLTAKCQFDSATGLSFTGSNAPSTYVAFQTGAVTKTLPATVSCTRGGSAPTFTWDGDSATGGSTGGVVQGLLYTIGATAAQTSAGSAPTYLNGASTPGSARTLDVTVTFGIAGGQAGGANGSAAIPQRTLTVVY